ncbi:hypothetical protein TSUD_404100 [Trifolium subterraneum]|uniref:Uncharacterized protein n=1 Tax=Trifolium subterraneum TaxID=3900 RepID=A0A2Z6NZE6_TRISU|nr:hypothetical protein TSUD_404100 [Trifolium subterraneum]
MRVSERVGGAAPRAFLGRSFQSSPSPEVRQIRGGALVDSGEWTEVRNRRRRALQEAEEDADRVWQNRHHRVRSISKPRQLFCCDQHDWCKHKNRDHQRLGRSQIRYDKERYCELCRLGLRNFQPRSQSRKHFQAVRSVSMHGGRRYRDYEERRRSEEMEEASRLYNGKQDKQRMKGSSWCHDQGKLQLANVDVSVPDKELREYGSDGKVVPDFMCSTLKRYVSFYFTNFAAQLSHFYLRKGFEFALAWLNLNAMPRGRLREYSGAGMLKGADESLKKHDFQNYSRHAALTGGEVRTITTGSKMTRGGTLDLGPEKEGYGPTDGVRVGDIVIKLGPQQRHDNRKDGKNNGDVRKPKESVTPVEWVQSGLVATIFNGEAIPIVQNRITDAGFNDVVIIPLGADKVFVRSTEGVDTLTIVINAEDFFKIVFSNWTRWKTDVLSYQRGAWVRLYGVPLHAWNVNFFKLCVLDCGRFLRADSCSADKDRLDFARVLIATSDLDIVNRVERILVDGFQGRGSVFYEFGSLGQSREHDSRIGVKPQSQDSQVRAGETGRDAGNQTRSKRAISCPPTATRTVISGPWSLEWLHDQNDGDAGVLFSASKKVAKGDKYGKTSEAGGESSSSASVNNDWQHWVAMQGNDQMVEEDVREIGNSIGVQFNGDNANMFSVLSEGEKHKKWG